VVLGECLDENIVTVDDVVVHSVCFEDNLRHLDTALGKLTTTGFTMNAKNAAFVNRRLSS
jgi:hypothetical protein